MRTGTGRGRFGRPGALLLALAAAFPSACATPPAAPPRPAATPTPAPKPAPPPAAAIPDQPFRGTPVQTDRPYAEIVRLRQSGQSNETLLEKVRSENVLYSLSIFEIQRLRAAGVSDQVIEAMLASGKTARTPTPR
jgi:hypothetical protein